MSCDAIDQQGERDASQKSPSLRDALSAALPRGSYARIRYVRSRTKRSEPLFSPLPASKGEETRLTSHFLTVSTNVKVQDSSRDVLVYAVEVLAYSTRRLTTLFVSKADSTGFREQRNPVPVRNITTSFLKWLLDREIAKKPSRTVVVSLFGRAQGAYLFPGSAENSKKHVLDDRQLIKWWAKTLDPLLKPLISDKPLKPRHGYITVPGYQGIELRQFMPPGGTYWEAGNPLQQLATIRGLPEHAPTRCLLPRYPDDPKARFMQDLDDEVGLDEDAGASAVLSPSKRKDGRWKTIHNLDRFWESMEFRQECSSGRVVGFLWLVINAHQPAVQSRQQSPSRVPPEEKQVKNNKTTANGHEHKSKLEKLKKSGRLRGPIVVRTPRIKGRTASSRSTGDGSVLTLAPAGYDQALQTLLHLDFATPESAAMSTQKWLAGIAAVARLSVDAWTLDVFGTADQPLQGVATTAGQINDLGSMIRKKKRSHDGGNAGHEAVKNATILDKAPVMLGAGLVRKKPKVLKDD